MRFAWTRSPLHPQWWLGWHLNSVLLLSSAVHGTLLAVIYRTFVDPSGFDAAQLVTQPGTLLLALALRAYIGRQRGVPMRFATVPKMEPMQARTIHGAVAAIGCAITRSYLLRQAAQQSLRVDVRATPRSRRMDDASLTA